MAKYAVMSDLHGNLQALEKVHDDIRKFNIQGLIFLGDFIDYGMQSNEVIDFLQNKFSYKVISSIWGNHEKAIMSSDFTRFSSQRGVESARYTANVLNEKSKEYIEGLSGRQGYEEFILDGKKCLAVHGSLEDPYWKSIFPDNVHGEYAEYDVVFSGHSHYSHVFTKFYDATDPERRNKHAVMFINPGSVGQPRNHHPQAQYAIFDTETLAVDLRSVFYDIKKAMSYYGDKVDLFYRERLKNGV